MRKRLSILLLRSIFLLLACILAGCVTWDLKKAKDHWQEKDYAWVSSQEISCSTSDEGCNQLHLLKGDSCLRLATDGKDPQKNYLCAAEHLGKGIDMTSQWQIGDLDLNRAQTYENLCEALRNLQDMKKGSEAEEYTLQLLKRSQEYQALEPSNLAAIYFANSAQFTLLRKEILHPANPPSLCARLNHLLQNLEEPSSRALGTKYDSNYHRLRADITGAKRSIPGCQ